MNPFSSIPCHVSNPDDGKRSRNFEQILVDATAGSSHVFTVDRPRPLCILVVNLCRSGSRRARAPIASRTTRPTRSSAFPTISSTPSPGQSPSDLRHITKTSEPLATRIDERHPRSDKNAQTAAVRKEYSYARSTIVMWTGFPSVYFALFLFPTSSNSSEQLGTFKEFIKTFPEIDTPEIFGLHPNADLTFRVKEVNALFGTLGNTQPKVRSTSHAVLCTACRMQHTCMDVEGTERTTILT